MLSANSDFPAVLPAESSAPSAGVPVNACANQPIEPRLAPSTLRLPSCGHCWSATVVSPSERVHGRGRRLASPWDPATILSFFEERIPPFTAVSYPQIESLPRSINPIETSISTDLTLLWNDFANPVYHIQ